MRMYNHTIMHGDCLFPMQIGAAAKCAAKGVMPAEGRMGRVLSVPACDCLPCVRRTCEVFLGRGNEAPFLFDVMLPSQEGTP